MNDAPQIEEAVFYGWKGYRLVCGPLAIGVAPDLGGRIISLAHEGTELLFVQQEHLGEVFDLDGATDLRALKRRLGFRLWGGDKTWIAPQSSWWEGIPPLDLDAGRYRVRVDGDTLSLQVGYGGGCRVHQFGLVISSDFMESEPVQTTALLTHDADGDPCEAYILTWLIADLAPLKVEWQTAYQADSGTIVLHLQVPTSEADCDTSWSGPGSCSLLYSF